MKDLAHVDLDYCQFSDWGYQKPTRIWGPSYLRNLKPRVCDIHTCPNVITRSSGHQGHRRILGATPQDGAPRVCLDDQYRIPEGLIRYIMGWDRVPTDWILSPIKPGDFNPKPPSTEPPITLPPVTGKSYSELPLHFRQEWGKSLGLPEDCTLCTEGKCCYEKSPPEAQVLSTNCSSHPHPCRHICNILDRIPMQEDSTPVTPRRGPRTALSKEKREDRPKSSPPSSMVRTLPHPRHFATSTQTVIPQVRVNHQ